MTSSQLQIWMGQRLLPEAPIYNLAVALHIRGEIDPAHFGQAFQSLINSSDALRTIVEVADEVPVRRVKPDLIYPLRLIDLSVVSDPRDEALRSMHRLCRIPLNLEKCLFDSSLFKISPNEFIWYLNLHHLIGDGWSFELIYRRMADLYQRSLEGCLPEAVELCPYEAYVAYERSYRQSERHRRSETYWRQFREDNCGDLAFYGKSGRRNTTGVRRASWNLGPERTKDLRALAATLASDTEQASLLQVFAAILVAYLYRLNGKASYTVGIPFHNRRSKNFKETIGFFSEILPVRFDVSEEDTFASLVSKAKSAVFTAARYGQYPIANPYFERVYEVALNYHTRAFSEFAGMPASPQWLHNGHGDDALAIQVSDFTSASSLSVDFDLHEEVFAEDDADRLIAHFSRVLDVFLADPERPLQFVSLATPEETERILEWSDGGTTALPDGCVHHWFEEQVKARPDARAVVFAGNELSYSQLNQRANQVAHFLRKRGVGSETIVALYVERSMEMLVGILGILKSGAAYVPIHPEYPPDWIEFVLRDARTGVVLTQEHLVNDLAKNGREIIALDPASFAREGAANPDTPISGDQIAYVMYTSGSTGNPKGVEISHGALANFTRAAGDRFGLGPGDRVLQFASPAFDTSIEEIFPCLTHGATLVLRTNPMLDSVASFLERATDWRITVLDLPTAYWHELVTALASEGLALPSSLRLTIIGGEKAIPEKHALWHRCVGRSVKLLNTYGPTETTVAAAVCDLTDYFTGENASAEVPIGRPIHNVQTYVLDSNLLPVPIGVPGELYIGGAGLARGYLNQPALTAEKFIRSPFDKENGGRLFRTGDIVRYRPDGNLEFLGRIDRQVKARGFRVELDGIEAALREHPLVSDAAVLVDGIAAHQRLVAYVVPKQGAVLNSADLKRYAGAKLPAYMLPTDIVTLDALPLSHNGKIDHRALMSLDRLVRSNRVVVPPQTATESRLATLWGEVLGVPEVGRDDHFFEIGGHSLLAAQVVSRIRKEFRLEIPLRAMFEAPTLTQFAQRIDEASARAENHDASVPVSPSHRSDELPVSQSQARIWYMHQLAPESAAYNIAVPVRFTGVLRKEALVLSWNELIRRHDSLRTTFRNKDGVPIQVVTPALHLDIPEIDFRTESDERLRLDRAKEILSTEARRPFDLENGPLIRAMLLRLSDDDQVLFINMHHVISDQWSMGVIAREMAALYNTFCDSSAPSADLPCRQYADFALWQDRCSKFDDLQDQLDYWRSQLAALEPVALPTDHPRPPLQTFHGARQSIDLPTGLVERLKRNAAQENATLFMIFLAAFKTLLHRYSGQDDLVVGTPVANRSRLEWENVVGTFINILVLRTDLSGEPNFRQVLRRVRRVVLDAFSHADVPFETLVSEMQSGRDPSHSPLIQVLFNFQSTAVTNLDLMNLSWMPFEIDQGAAQFDLSITVDPQITRKLWIAYNTDLFKEDTISRMLRHYRRLIEAVAGNPDHRIDTMPILAEDERRRILREWNATEAAFPQVCVHELIEAQVQKRPKAVAIEFERQQISYEELNRRADHVAVHLRKCGVCPDALVGICAERSIGLLIGMLGILKAGGAYVPIDPAYPPDRIAFMIKDSGMRVLLTQEKLKERLPLGGYETLCLDLLGEIADSGLTHRSAPVQPSNLAYVIYTSGSTGTPKGVEVEHRSLVNFLHSMRSKPGMTAQDVLLSVTTVSFDIAALELFLPLIVGARVVLSSRQIAADGHRLKELLETSGATIMQATPTTWRMLIEAGWKGPESFKVLCGGESFPVDLANRLLEHGNAVWNLYGPTETTVWSTAYQLTGRSELVPIGKPIENTQSYILDRNREPVPVGVRGELFIGGQGVARGYRKRPELTAEKFIRDPFSRIKGARLFRTGDVARYLPDGNIECLGRMDHQLKIRGHRIEPGEIETALREHSAIRQALVISREDTPGDKQLVAYVVMREKSGCRPEEMRRFLLRKLPDYMVPTAFVSVDALPLTPGGKLDRNALPRPDLNSSCGQTVFIPPRDRLEFQLAQIWELVLNVKLIGIKHNFFDLGGHSLIVVKLVSELKHRLGIDLPIYSVFAAPTIEELAKTIRREGWAPPRNCLFEIKSSGSKNPLFIIPGGYPIRLHLGPDQPIYGLSFLGMFDERQINHTNLSDIASSYVRSIRTLQPRGPYYLAGHSSGGTIAFEMARLLHAEGEEVGLLALLDTYGPQTSKTGFKQTLKCHWDAFMQRAPKERLSYLMFVLNKALSAVILPLRRKFWLAVHPCFLSGQPVSPTAKNLSMAYDLAFENHEVRSFSGNGVLFRARDAKAGFCDTPDRGWRGSFTGGLEIHEIPGDHLSMLDEPHRQDLTKRLQECLRLAQSEYGGTSTPD